MFLWWSFLILADCIKHWELKWPHQCLLLFRNAFFFFPVTNYMSCVCVFGQHLVFKVVHLSKLLASACYVCALTLPNCTKDTLFTYILHCWFCQHWKAQCFEGSRDEWRDGSGISPDRNLEMSQRSSCAEGGAVVLVMPVFMPCILIRINFPHFCLHVVPNVNSMK